MHELTMAQELIRIVEDEQLRHGFEKVEVVKIKAGGFSGIDRHALDFAFQVVREGTCAAQARLELNIEPVKIVCRSCGFSMSARDAASSCPLCKSLDIALEGDSSFEIVALEVD